MPKKARPIATLDAETDPFIHGRLPEPFLWDIFDGERHFTFEHTCDVVAFLKDKEWIVYAHNGGKFDYHLSGFLNELEPWEPISIINGRLAKFKIGSCEFRDSCNLLPMKLAGYKKDAIDYALFEREKRHAHMDKITAYLHSDTAYLYELVSAFRASYGDALTLAGAAMKVWQARSGEDAPRSSRGFYNTLAPFYYGGRVEALACGIVSRPFTLVDICSAYPYAMLQQHPISTAYEADIPALTDAIIPQAMYSIRGIGRGAWPVREKTGLAFPVDATVRDFAITGWELQAGLDTGSRLDSIHCRLVFDRCLDFAGYVHHFYDIKKGSAKGSTDYIFAKLFMNSLYGKFGANPDNYNNFTVCEPKFIEAASEDGMTFAGELGPWAVMSSELEEAQIRYYNAATAASITGFVRAYLWRHMHAIGKAGGKVLYCDTDSIAFTGKVPAMMTLGKELGEWGVEGKFVSGGIGGKKLYAFLSDKGEWKCGCKGVDITPAEILKVCQGETVTYKRDAPSFGHGKKTRFLVREVRMTGKTVGSC